MPQSGAHGQRPACDVRTRRNCRRARGDGRAAWPAAKGAAAQPQTCQGMGAWRAVNRPVAGCRSVCQWGSVHFGPRPARRGGHGLDAWGIPYRVRFDDVGCACGSCGLETTNLGWHERAGLATGHRVGGGGTCLKIQGCSNTLKKLAGPPQEFLALEGRNERSEFFKGGLTHRLWWQTL